MPLRVFIADDSAPIAEMLTELLSRPGQVEIVGIGATESETVDAIGKLRPDVVLLDLQLREGSGTGVIKAVRAAPDLQGVRLFVTSNHTSEQMRAGCLQLGADAYFDKVKEIPQIAERVAAMALERDAAD